MKGTLTLESSGLGIFSAFKVLLDLNKAFLLQTNRVTQPEIVCFQKHFNTFISHAIVIVLPWCTGWEILNRSKQTPFLPWKRQKCLSFTAVSPRLCTQQHCLTKWKMTIRSYDKLCLTCNVIHFLGTGWCIPYTTHTFRELLTWRKNWEKATEHSSSDTISDYLHNL